MGSRSCTTLPPTCRYLNSGCRCLPLLRDTKVLLSYTRYLLRYLDTVLYCTAEWELDGTTRDKAFVQCSQRPRSAPFLCTDTCQRRRQRLTRLLIFRARRIARILCTRRSFDGHVPAMPVPIMSMFVLRRRVCRGLVHLDYSKHCSCVSYAFEPS